jgi:hypothetical protein
VVDVTPCPRCGKEGPASEAVCSGCGAPRGTLNLKAALEQGRDLARLGDGAREPEWASVVKLLAVPASVLGVLALAIWGLRACDNLLPASTVGWAVLTVALFAAVGLGAGFLYFVLGAILARLGGVKPVPVRVVGYSLLLGFCLGVACAVVVLGSLQREN